MSGLADSGQQLTISRGGYVMEGPGNVLYARLPELRDRVAAEL